VYTSLNTGKFPVITSGIYKFTPGIPVQFSEGNDATIIALGSAVHDVLDAVRLLGTSGYSIKADIFSLSSIRPLQTATLISSIKKTGKVLTVEQHSTHGGAGSIIAELIADNGLCAKLKRKGIPEGSFSINQTQAYNKTFFSLDAAGIQKTIFDFLF
jgi:transketolase